MPVKFRVNKCCATICKMSPDFILVYAVFFFSYKPFYSESQTCFSTHGCRKNKQDCLWSLICRGMFLSKISLCVLSMNSEKSNRTHRIQEEINPLFHCALKM